MDTAAGFLTGGPVLKAGRVDFECEGLDFEEDATLTMRELWGRRENQNALKYRKNGHGPSEIMTRYNNKKHTIQGSTNCQRNTLIITATVC